MENKDKCVFLFEILQYLYISICIAAYKANGLFKLLKGHTTLWSAYNMILARVICVELHGQITTLLRKTIRKF